MTAFMGDCIRQRSVYKHLATGLTEFCALPEPAAGFKLLTRAFQVIEGATGMGKIELAEHVVGGPGEVHQFTRSKDRSKMGDPSQISWQFMVMENDDSPVDAMGYQISSVSAL